MLVIIATSSFFIKKTHLKTNEMLVGEGSTESDSMSVTKVSKTSFDRFILNDKNTRVEYKPLTFLKIGSLMLKKKLGIAKHYLLKR